MSRESFVHILCVGFHTSLLQRKPPFVCSELLIKIFDIFSIHDGLGKGTHLVTSKATSSRFSVSRLIASIRKFTSIAHIRCASSSLRANENRFFAPGVTVGAKIMHWFTGLLIFLERKYVNTGSYFFKTISRKVGFKCLEFGIFSFKCVDFLLNRRIHLREFNLLKFDIQRSTNSVRQPLSNVEHGRVNDALITRVNCASKDLASAIDGAYESRNR